VNLRARCVAAIIAAGLIATSVRPAFCTAVPNQSAGSLVWATSTPMPTPRFGLGVVAAENGRIYAVVGTNLSRASSQSTEEYDPIAGSWALKANLPTGRTDLAVVAGTGTGVYALGGVSDSLRVLNTLEIFDPASTTWSGRQSMLTARAEMGAVAGPNGRLYAFGGIDDHARVLGSVEEYDPSTNQWRLRAPLGTGSGRAARGGEQRQSVRDLRNHHRCPDRRDR
jgi:N-acetylneuraminic acid mutarotase